MAEMLGVATSQKEAIAKANKHLQDAEKFINNWRVAANAPNIKFEDATTAYQKAAEAFRTVSKWQEACDAYAAAADIQLRMGCAEEAASFASEAAEAAVKFNPADAVVFYRNAISLFCEVGRFGTAGRLQKKLAEWYEEDRNYDECIDQYRQASDYYLGDGMVQQSDLCLLKCAYYQGLMEEFDDAAEIYANVGLRCLDHNLIKFNARDYFLRCGLVMLAAGETHHRKLKKYLMKFKHRDPSFCYSRECLFLENLLAMHGSSNIHVFADHVYDFDNVSHLDSWCLEMLYELKTQVQTMFEENTKKEVEEMQKKKEEYAQEQAEKEEKKRLSKVRA